MTVLWGSRQPFGCRSQGSRSASPKDNCEGLFKYLLVFVDATYLHLQNETNPFVQQVPTQNTTSSVGYQEKSIGK